MKTQPASGEKHSRKRMALLVAIHDSWPAPRTADDFLDVPGRRDTAHPVPLERRPGRRPV